MRITESQLRKIVRDEVLRESVYNTPRGQEIDRILQPYYAAWDPTQEDGVIRVTFDPGIRPRDFASALAELQGRGFVLRSKYRAGALLEVPENLQLLLRTK